MKRFLATALLFCSFVAQAQVGRVVCDETCRIEYLKTSPYEQPHQPTQQTPSATPLQPSESAASTAVARQEKPIVGYAVVSPMGHATVEPIVQAPRLGTLDGKRIAVVGVSFMTGITHPEIKALIKQYHPTAEVFLLDEVGYAGPYPAPGVKRELCDRFKSKLRELRIDAVISGNGGCGLCTPKEVGSCIAAEVEGVPSVMIAGPGFTEQAHYTALNNGLRVLRVAEYPGAFASDAEEVIREKVRTILWPQIVRGLTEPITEEEIAASDSSSRGDIRNDVFYGTYQEVNEYFAEQNWTDGLPIVPPTFDVVEDYLRYTPYKWNETVAVLPIAHRNTTAWHVAVNAVMAGCKPEHMPIVVALTKGLGDGSFRRTLASTHAWAPYCWLNGPLARRLGIDCGQGQINEAANVAIGRYLNLALMNLCGYYVKKDRMGTFGYPMPWCLVEDEEACRRVGWEPYHVRKGFDAEDNVVTLGSTLLWGNNMAPSTTNPDRIVDLLAWDISERGQFALGSGKQFTFRTILITEPVAQILASKYDLAKLEKLLIRRSRRPLRERAFANYFANPGSRKDGGKHTYKQYEAHLARTEGATSTAPPVWYETNQSSVNTVATMKPGMTAFLVTGDGARNKIQTMPGGGYVSVKIELPDNWNELLVALGYEAEE